MTWPPLVSTARPQVASQNGQVRKCVWVAASMAGAYAVVTSTGFERPAAVAASADVVATIR